MRILIALAVLVVLGLLVSSERFWKFRRHPLGAVLSTGGWVAVAIGLLLGPHGVRLVTVEHAQVLRPLILFCLGWVGVMVGLQLRRDLPVLLPAGSMRLALRDFVITMVVLPAVTAGALVFGAEQIDWPGVIVLAALMGACSVGWSPEVRSLVRDRRQTGEANYLRSASGLGSVLALVAYGFAFMLIKHGAKPAADATPALEFSGLPLVAGLAVSLVIAAVFGLVGAWLMRLAGRSESQFLVILLGLISLATGAAATMGYSPLFVAMLCGAVAVNVPGDVLTRFKRVIVEAEQPIAMVTMLTAGVLANPALSATAGLVLLGALGGRILLKVGLAWRDRQLRAGAQDSALSVGPLRQAPLAVAMAMGYAVSGHETLTAGLLGGGELVMIVILIGLLTDIAPLAQRLRRSGESPAAGPAREGGSTA